MVALLGDDEHEQWSHEIVMPPRVLSQSVEGRGSLTDVI